MTANFTPQERLESIKAGLIAGASGLCVGLAWNTGLFFSGLGHHGRIQAIPTSIMGFPSALILDTALTTFSAFLFGVTYRYIIRQDQRSHLKSGAVGAFALVRGLSQIEGAWTGSFSWLSLLPLGESFISIAIAQIILDLALKRNALKPFG